MSRDPRAALQRLRFRMWRANKLRLWRMQNPEAWASYEMADRLTFSANRKERAPNALTEMMVVNGQQMTFFRWSRLASRRVPMAGPRGALP